MRRIQFSKVILYSRIFEYHSIVLILVRQKACSTVKEKKVSVSYCIFSTLSMTNCCFLSTRHVKLIMYKKGRYLRLGSLVLEKIGFACTESKGKMGERYFNQKYFLMFQRCLIAGNNLTTEEEKANTTLLFNTSSYIHNNSSLRRLYNVVVESSIDQHNSK